MGLAPAVGAVAAGEDAATVADDQGGTLGRGGEAAGTADVEDLSGGVDEHPADRAVAARRWIVAFGTGPAPTISERLRRSALGTTRPSSVRWSEWPYTSPHSPRPHGRGSVVRAGASAVR